MYNVLYLVLLKMFENIGLTFDFGKSRMFRKMNFMVYDEKEFCFDSGFSEEEESFEICFGFWPGVDIVALIVTVERIVLVFYQQL